MFLKPKILFISLMIFLMIPSIIIPQAFSFTGPSTVVVPYGQNTAAATFYFTYYQMPGAVGPKLAIELDDQLLAGAVCSGGSTSYMPSSYTFNLSPGSHSIRFAMNSLGEHEPCGETYINWQTSETTVSCKFKVRAENIFSGGTIYVDNLTTQKNSPYDRTSYTSDNFQIGAIDQSSGGYNWIWNTSGTNNSSWRKRLSTGSETPYSSSRNTTYTVQSSDKNTELIAGLRKILNNVRVRSKKLNFRISVFKIYCCKKFC